MRWDHEAGARAIQEADKIALGGAQHSREFHHKIWNAAIAEAERQISAAHVAGGFSEIPDHEARGDLFERLTAWEPAIETARHLMSEAAAEIERLRAERIRLLAEAVSGERRGRVAGLLRAAEVASHYANVEPAVTAIRHEADRIEREGGR